MSDNYRPKRKVEVPEFKADPIEVWSSVGLTALLIVVSTYASWLAASVGGAAVFHITHGISASWVAFCGIQISVLSGILAWRGFGLNAVAALLGSTALGTSLINTNIYRLSAATTAASVVLVAAIYLTRRFFEHNPLQTFMSLWGLTFTSSVLQSFIYRFIFDHSYPLQGVLLLKFGLFSLGGLMLFFTFPRKNKEYTI